MPLKEGDTLGSYRVLGQLGQGGMATVYKAYHAQLDRYVAVKMMHQAFLEDKSFHTRFEREARVLAGLTHPHIVPVYDYSEYEGQPYLVMKFIEGRTLKGTLVDGALTLTQVLDVMAAVGSALNYAHGKGVLHRDIKPSNVVIENDGTPYLTDFGLARLVQAGESTVSSDMVLGTPHYMSPEQARGDKDIDTRADVYSLGVVLYELVVGRVPFSADTPYAIIHDHIYTPLPMPSTVNPEIPAAVEMVLVKTLSKDRSDRYETAVDMVTAFKQAVADSKMTQLNPDRVSIAGLSLARLREEVAAAPRGTSVPSPVLTMVLPSETELLRQRRRGRRWMWGGLFSFCAISTLSLLLVGNAFSVLDEVSPADTPSLPTVANLPPLMTGTPDDDGNLAAQATLDASPPVTGTPASDVIATVLAAVQADPDNPEFYIALAVAYWEAGELRAAQDALRAGQPYVDDMVGYMLTAARAADSAGQSAVAITLYFLALAASENSPPVRDEVGAYIYGVVVDDATINVALLMRNFDPPPGVVFDASVVSVFAARAEIAQRRYFAARRTLTQASDTFFQAEWHLVLGELYLAQGEEALARDEFQVAIDAPGAPAWVVRRAEELLGR